MKKIHTDIEAEFFIRFNRYKLTMSNCYKTAKIAGRLVGEETKANFNFCVYFIADP